MSDLIQKLQSADGPSRELDAEIWAHVGGWKLVTQEDGVEVRAERYDGDVVSEWESVGFIDSGGHFRVYMSFEEDLPAYSASLDAALALVGEIAPENARFEICKWSKDWAVKWLNWKSGVWYITEHKHPAIALLIALLRAIEGGDDG